MDDGRLEFLPHVKKEKSMTPQEAQMLQDLVNKVEGTQLTEKDPDAEALLNDGLARDPDALYKLAQTVLVQNLALNQARTQLQAQADQLRQQSAPQPARATSFLGSLLGHRDPAPPPPPQPAYQQPQYAPPQYQTVPQYQAAPPVGYAPASSGTGSFLRSAATTAAGVAAGALAFEGIESLMHGGEHGGFFGGGGGDYGGYGMGGAPVEETVVNNYYGDSNDQVSGPDEQPQGPYDDNISGPDEQPQGPYDDSGGVEDASYDDSSFGDDGGGDSLV